MPEGLMFNEPGGGLFVSARDLEQHMRDLSLRHGRPEFDVQSVVDAKFAAGEGVLTFSRDTPDALILMAIRRGIAMGKPFTVIPAGLQARTTARMPATR